MLPLFERHHHGGKMHAARQMEMIDSPGYLPSESWSISSIADFGRLHRQTGGSPASRRLA
jgi:hypothetical protein